ncbi:MAG: GNAT family N-acetyltransferase [Clostridia bacterium]|nr:GNAT family N-acetyltransferase [Clostridia bacterium]
MELKAATEQQLETVMALIEQARAHLKEQGIDQWQNGQPNETMIREDLKRGQGYLMMAEGEAVGYFCLLPDGDKVYDSSPVAWQTSRNYAAIHRVAMGDGYRGKGYAVEGFTLATEHFRKLGKEALRIDTHEDNKKMQGFLTKLGFTCCGKLFVPNVGERLAFEKSI